MTSTFQQWRNCFERQGAAHGCKSTASKTLFFDPMTGFSWQICGSGKGDSCGRGIRDASWGERDAAWLPRLMNQKATKSLVLETPNRVGSLWLS